jgi:hypothetical protein
MANKTKFAKPSISHFKPNFKPLGFTSPRWQIINYVAKMHAHVTNHPLYQRFRSSPLWHEPPQKEK